MTIQDIWACSCGEETPCEPGDLKGGSVWRCEGCGKVFGCVYKRCGGKVWITIDASEVEFHDILGRPMDRDDDEDDAA